MKQKSRQTGGFTLIELIAVISLLAILSFLAVGGYAGYQAAYRDYAAEKALGILQDAYLYARSTEADDMAAAEQVASLVSDEMHGHYTIIPAGNRYTISYESNGKIYTLEDGQIADDEPVTDPIQVVTALTGKMYEDMHTVVSDLKGLTANEKHKYFEEHGYKHPNNSLGNDAYRQYLFNTIYENSWPEFTEGFREKYNLPSGLYIQPFVKDIENPEEVVVFANGNNSTQGNWHTNMVCIDGVWYYGGKTYLSITISYSELKEKVTTTWTALQ